MAAPQHTLVGKLVRYSLASAVGTVFGTGSLAVFHAVFGWPALISNLASVTVGAVPNYLINRYWTWRRSGRHRMGVEAIAFWLIALLGLAISTVFVAYADNRWGTTFALVVAQMVGFGLLWVGRFVFLDKVLYKVAEVLEDQLEEAHGEA